ncbi:MAG: hypothetical protein IJ192_09125 [Clostridia bacterium]|nr:hypothetical protein [Clostridia bacterium]
MKENKRFKKGALAAAVFSTAILVTGCGIYGPEAYQELPDKKESDYSDVITENESEQPESDSEFEENSFWVEDNINEEVYGPPPLEDDESSEEEISEESEEDTFQVEDNSNVAVYGPPPTT